MRNWTEGLTVLVYPRVVTSLLHEYHDFVIFRFLKAVSISQKRDMDVPVL